MSSSSNKRKTGGAYRRKKMAISLYCKDKGKKPKTATPGREKEIIVKTRALHERENANGKNKNNDSRLERIPV